LKASFDLAFFIVVPRQQKTSSALSSSEKSFKMLPSVMIVSIFGWLIGTALLVRHFTLSYLESFTNNCSN
jgi:hypothetical protein